MANKNFSLNFDGFLEYADQLDKLGEQYLRKATENALIKSQDYLNQETENAMNNSKFNFNRTGRAKKSLAKIDQMPLEWDGYTAKTFVGVNIAEAPEGFILAVQGTPHQKADRNIYNAMKAKGKYRKQVDQIQMNEFEKVISEAMKNG